MNEKVTGLSMKMMGGNRKKLTAVLSLALVVCLITGGTLAYLFSHTEKKENVFTFADNISGLLEEPNWDPDKAENLVPGKKIEKDPQITNTSVNGVTEYAAIKITFQDGAGNTLSDADTLTLLNLIEIDWSGNWMLADGTLDKDAAGAVIDTTAEQIYVFHDVLPQNVTSDPVFYSVTIKHDVTPAQLKWLAGDYGHDSSCYIFGLHDPVLCTETYRHHEKCAIYGMSGADSVAAGGTLGSDTCGCSAAEIHTSACPSLIGTLDGSCAHTTIVSGLGNFIIKVEGAVVQADSFSSLADASAALITLFP